MPLRGPVCQQQRRTRCSNSACIVLAHVGTTPLCAQPPQVPTAGCWLVCWWVCWVCSWQHPLYLVGVFVHVGGVVYLLPPPQIVGACVFFCKYVHRGEYASGPPGTCTCTLSAARVLGQTESGLRLGHGGGGVIIWCTNASLCVTRTHTPCHAVAPVVPPLVCLLLLPVPRVSQHVCTPPPTTRCSRRQQWPPASPIQT